MYRRQENKNKKYPKEKGKGRRQSGFLRRLYKYLRKKVKSKGKRERHTKLNAEFQRIARRDKKVFFNEQCKEIEENNRRGKIRDFLKKIGNIKGTFHSKTFTTK